MTRMYILSRKSSILNDFSIQIGHCAKMSHLDRYLDSESASVLGGTLLIRRCLLWQQLCFQFSILKNGETLRVHRLSSHTRVVS